MNARILTILPLAALSMASVAESATVLLLEDFEDSTVNYTTSVSEFSDGFTDYFGRVGDGGITVAGSVAVGNIQGTGYFAANDIDGEGGPASASMLLTVDITGYSDLAFQAFFAEDDDAANQDWDPDTAVRIFASIDGGAFFQIFGIESSGGTNTEPAIDTNFDGVGDGDSITSDFTLYTAAIAGTGSTLTVRLDFDILDAGDEDIAIDNISIISVPEPSIALLGGIGLLGLLRRRR